VGREDQLGGFELEEMIEEDGGSTDGFLMEGGVGFSDTERRPIKVLYSVFSRPRNDAHRQASELAARWGALDMGGDLEEEMDRPPGVSEEDWRASLPGEAIEEEGRLLLQGLGTEEGMVYAAPTTNDHVCHTLLPNGGGGCGAPGPDGLDLHWVYQPSRPLVVYGLVGDEITSVDVVIAGQTYAARMGENAFGIRVEGAKPNELVS
jgi:hypothetical protein